VKFVPTKKDKTTTIPLPSFFVVVGSWSEIWDSDIKKVRIRDPGLTPRIRNAAKYPLKFVLKSLHVF
jgi:hypothetical protein